MSQWRALYALAWKDGRQLSAMFVAIYSVAILFALLYCRHGEVEIAQSINLTSIFLLLFPNLLALSAGALLIGNEEELRSLAWLQSLPVSWRQVSLMKFLLAVGCVVALWGACFVLARGVLWANSTPSSLPMNYGWEGFDLGHSLLLTLHLLSISFLTAWGMRSALGGLFAVIPVGLVSLIALPFVQESLGNDGPGTSATFLAGTSCCYIATAFWLARRRFTSQEWRFALAKNDPYDDELVLVLPACRPHPAISLVWQHWRQTRWLLLGTLFFGILMVLWLPFSGFLLPYILMSFLGALAFATDQTNRRHFFVADRGISPAAFWRSRQLIPIVASVVGLNTALVLVALFGDPVLLAELPRATVIAILNTTAMAFALGQLSGMWWQRPAIGVCCAPLLAFLAIGATSFFLQGIGIFHLPMLLFVVWSLSATYLMTRRWMDDRRDFTFHATMASALLGPVAVIWLVSMLF